jgi:hypothetical protein
MITVGECSPTVSDGGRIGGTAVLDAALQIGQQVLGGLDAGIGQQQRGLQILVERLVDLRPGEHLSQAGAGLAQAGTQLVEPAAALG